MYLQIEVGKLILDEWLKNHVPINSLAKSIKFKGKLSVITLNRGVKVADRKESRKTKKEVRQV